MTPRACYACGRPIQRDPLSKVDAAVFRFVSFHMSEHGCAPTHQEVCDLVGSEEA